MNKKPLIRRTKKSYILITCVGLALMAAGSLAGIYWMDHRLIGFGAGLGAAAAGLGALGLLLMGRNPEKVREQEIMDKDERFVKIREKSAMSAWYVTLLGLAAGEFVFLALDNSAVCAAIIALMALHIIGYFAFLFINGKRM